MLSLKEAEKIVKKNIKNCTIENYAVFKGKYVFIATTKDPYEGNMDPYYSVDMKTGHFEGYPIMLPEYSEVLKLFK